MPSETSKVHADELRAAVDWFNEQPISTSAITTLTDRVLDVAERLAPEFAHAPTPIRGRADRATQIRNDSLRLQRLK